MQVELFPDGGLVDRRSGKCVGQAGSARGAGSLLQLQTCVQDRKLHASAPAKSTQSPLRTEDPVVSRVGDTEASRESRGLEAAKDSTRDHQRWTLDKRTGELSLRTSEGRQCLTAGWPFLTGASFQVRVVYW